MSLVLWTHFRLVRKRGEGLPPTQNLFLLFSFLNMTMATTKYFHFAITLLHLSKLKQGSRGL